MYRLALAGVLVFVMGACKENITQEVNYDDLVGIIKENKSTADCYWIYDVVASENDRNYQYISYICFPIGDKLGSSFTRKLDLKIKKSEVKIDKNKPTVSLDDITKL